MQWEVVRMKRFVVALLLCLLVEPVGLAKGPPRGRQTRFTLTAGPAFLGDGDMKALYFRNEYSRDITRRFSLGLGLAHAHAARIQSNSDGLNDNWFSQMTSVDLSFSFSLVRRARHRIELGAGPSLLAAATIQPSTHFTAPEGSTQVSYANHTSDKYMSAGFTAWIATQWRLAGPWLFGIRAGGARYGSGDLNWFAGLETGVTF